MRTAPVNPSIPGPLNVPRNWGEIPLPTVGVAVAVGVGVPECETYRFELLIQDLFRVSNFGFPTLFATGPRVPRVVSAPDNRSRRDSPP
jgi:hypothetical protein